MVFFRMSLNLKVIFVFLYIFKCFDVCGEK